MTILGMKARAGFAMTDCHRLGAVFLRPQTSCVTIGNRIEFFTYACGYICFMDACQKKRGSLKYAAWGTPSERRLSPCGTSYGMLQSL